MSTYYTDPHQNPYWQNLNNDRTSPSGSNQQRGTFEEDPNWHPEPEQGRQLGRTAAIFGIAAIFSTLFFPIIMPLALGSIAIVLAILSKGKQPSFTKGAKRAFITGIVAICLNLSMLVITICGLYVFYTNPSARASINHMSEQIYGYSLDDMLQQIMDQYGLSLPDTVMPIQDQPDSDTSVYPADSFALSEEHHQHI
jgi:hypothetical protein